MKKLTQALSALALAMGLAANAQAVPLSDLLAGGSITVGDKLFDTWTYNYIATDATRVFAPTNIDVSGIDNGGEYGLMFTVSEGELTVTGDDLYNFVDLSLGFRASVMTPGMGINGVTLNLVSAVLANSGEGGLGAPGSDLGSFIQEWVGTAAAGTDLVDWLEVEFSWLGGDTSEVGVLSDTGTFAPKSEVWVTKDILVWASLLTDTAGLFSFSQTFSQAAIPEPATALLLGLGLAGMGLARRRKA